MPVTIGTYGATGASGWTTITASNGTQPSGLTTNIIYVSRAAGASDSNDGASPVFTGGTNGPMRTPGYGSAANGAMYAAGKGTLGTGFCKRGAGYIPAPDWVLLERGYTYDSVGDSQVPSSGYSSDEPILIGTYGTGTRPIWLVSASGNTPPYASGALPNSGDYIAIIGIDFYASDRDPTNSTVSPIYNPQTVDLSTTGPAFGGAGNCHWGLLEDCKVRWGKSGTGFSQDPFVSGSYGIMRRCQIANCYSLYNNGNGFKSGGWDNLLIEENVVDRSAYYYDSTQLIFILSANANVTAGATYTNNSLTFTVQNTIVGSKVLTCNNPGFPNPDIDGISGTLTKSGGVGDTPLIFSFYTQTYDGNYGFVHGLYLSAYEYEYNPTTLASPPIIRGNIIAHEATTAKFNNFGFLSDNCFINNPTSYIVGAPNAGTSYTSTNDVTLEGKGNAVAHTENGPSTSGYQGWGEYNLGNINWTGNIVANQTGTNPSPAFDLIPYNYSVTNSIIFNCGSGIRADTGAIYTYSITNAGSGGSAAPTFTAGISDGAGNAGHILNVTAITGTPLQPMQRISGSGVPTETFIQNQLTGAAGGVGTYSVIINGDFLQRGANSIVLVAPGTTMQIESYHSTLQYSGAAGAGLGAEADIIVSGGVVTSCVVHTPYNYINLSAPNGNPNGTNYQVGETLEVTNTANIAGVTGAIFTVASINTQTTTNNKTELAPANANTYNFPGYPPDHTAASVKNVTSGTYYNSIGNPGGFPSTSDGFLAAVINNNKQNWDPRLTANNGINPWVRTAFGVGDTPTSGGGGGGAAPTHGNQYGKIKGPRVKMPHAFAAIGDIIAKAWKAISGLWSFRTHTEDVGEKHAAV